MTSRLRARAGGWEGALGAHIDAILDTRLTTFEQRVRGVTSAACADLERRLAGAVRGHVEALERRLAAALTRMAPRAGSQLPETRTSAGFS